MANEDILLPENCTIQVGSSTITYKVSSFRISGGERPRTYIRTFNRKHRRFNGLLSDYLIEADVAITGSAPFENLADKYDVIGSVSFSYSGDLTHSLSFHNIYSLKFDKESNADEYHKGTISFSCSPFDSTGSPNKVIT